MMAMTTRSSIRVNARRPAGGGVALEGKKSLLAIHVVGAPRRRRLPSGVGGPDAIVTPPAAGCQSNACG